MDGRLDTLTSPQLDEEINKIIEGAKKLIFDLDKLAYISSAGLRILVLFKKEAQATNNKMVIRNINDVVKEVFTVTGFDKILKII